MSYCAQHRTLFTSEWGCPQCMARLPLEQLRALGPFPNVGAVLRPGATGPECERPSRDQPGSAPDGESIAAETTGEET